MKIPIDVGRLAFLGCDGSTKSERRCEGEWGGMTKWCGVVGVAEAELLSFSLVRVVCVPIWRRNTSRPDVLRVIIGSPRCDGVVHGRIFERVKLAQTYVFGRRELFSVRQQSLNT